MQSDLKKIVANALAEDIGSGDITSNAVIGKNLKATLSFVSRQKIIVCGNDIVREVFCQVDKKVKVKSFFKDGEKASKGQVIIKVSGRARSILSAERVALNFLQHMSGIATFTREFVDKIRGTGTKILDTRKTLPGLRVIEKYAVKAGGGYNHRMGLYDAILIKDNHIAVCGSITEAIKLARKANPNKKIEVECDSVGQVKEALKAGADMLLLDNMNVGVLRQAVKIVKNKIPLEASGGITLPRIKKIAETGVDFISVGAITHSAPSVDIGLDLIYEN